MFIDFTNLLRAMIRWSKCLGIPGWKKLAYLHLPWALANATVFLGHLHKDKSTILKSLHPIFIFLGSVSTLVGSVLLIQERKRDQDLHNDTTLAKDLLGTSSSRTSAEPRSVGNGLFDYRYTLNCIVTAALFSYASLCMTAILSQ